jgi:hypothetical protein
MNGIIGYLIGILMEGKGLLGRCRVWRYIAPANHTGTSAAFKQIERSAKHNQN